MSPGPPMPPPPSRVAASGDEPPRLTWVGLSFALAFGVAVDSVMDGPPGSAVVLAAATATLGMIVLCRPRVDAIAFFAAGLAIISFVLVRASPILTGLDTV